MGTMRESDWSWGRRIVSSVGLIMMMMMMMVAIFSSVVQTDSATKSGNVKDYCEGETFKARCSYDEVIMMDVANYGRMKLDKCVKVNMGYIGCQANVLSIADEKCSGRRSCDVSIPDSDFELMRPCLELKSYLQASFHCVKVLTVDSNDCRTGKYLRPNPQNPPTSGRLASISAVETKCGSQDQKPWLIEVSHGQRINVTLVDFTARRTAGPPASPQGLPGGGGGGGGGTEGNACVRYATVVEKKIGGGEGEETFVVCGRQGRERHVYTSRNNVIQIQLEAATANPDYFLINYEAIGCPDPVISNAYWFRRMNGGDLLIGCKHSDDRWRLSCNHDNQWIGESMVNCTAANIISSEVIDISKAEKSPNAVLVAVLCVMVILIILLAILITMLIYKRYRRQHPPPLFTVDRSPKAKSKKSDEGGGSLTYNDPTGTVESTYTSTLGKNQRYGRHDESHRHPHHQQQQHCHLYDSPIAEKGRDGGSQYERVETCQTIAQFAHIWNTPLPKIPGQ